MAQDHARFKTSIWTDEDFIALPVGSQRAYLMIATQPEVTLCGVIQPAFKRWAGFAPDSKLENVEDSVMTLRDRNFVVIDDLTDELLIRSFVRHGVALNSPNAIVGMSQAFATIHSKDLQKVVIQELRKVDDQDLANKLSRDIPDGDKKPLRRRLSNSFVLAWDGAS